MTFDIKPNAKPIDLATTLFEHIEEGKIDLTAYLYPEDVARIDEALQSLWGFEAALNDRDLIEEM